MHEIHSFYLCMNSIYGNESLKKYIQFNQNQIKNVTNNFFLIVLCLSATFELMATTINSNKLQNTNQSQTNQNLQ